MAFAVESVPPEARLFCHPSKCAEGLLDCGTEPSVIAAFKGKKDSNDRRFRASVDWEKYKTIAECIRPKSMAILAVTAAQCRAVGKEVEHTPICETDLVNQAHCDICDPVGCPMSNTQNTEASSKLAEVAVIVWPEEGLSLITPPS